MKNDMVVLVNNNGRKLKPVSRKKAQKYIDHGLVDSYNDNEVRLNVSAGEANATIKKERPPSAGKAPCWACGIEVYADKPETKRVWCPECEQKHLKEQEEKSKQYMKIRSELMLERAIKLLEGQEFGVRITDYKEAAEVIRDAVECQFDKFDSAYEMLAAMELIVNHIKVKTHPVIGKDQPDFMLEEEKIILEIDGEMHQHKRRQDKEKDTRVRIALGAEWEVVRIPVEYLEKNIAKLSDAIFEIRDWMQLERKRNGGILPESFSKRDKLFWKSVRKK